MTTLTMNDQMPIQCFFHLFFIFIFFPFRIVSKYEDP